MMQHLIPFLFPYRAHLEAEIVWFQEQLAQKQRRIDELQEALIGLKQPSMKIQYVQKPDGALAPVTQPRGWDALRIARRANPPEPEPEIEGPFRTAATEEKPDAVQGE
jgi:hypothetical protein